MQAKITLSNLSAAEEKKAVDAMAYMAEIAGSIELEKFIKGYKWEVTYTTGALWWKRRVTEKGDNFRWNWMGDGKPMNKNALIKAIVDAKEHKLGEPEDSEIDIFLEVDRRNKRGVIGYTNEGTKWQWVYSWYINQYDVAEVAGNLFHEWLHKIGFDHEYKYNVLRDYTFVYAMGYWMVEQVRAKMRRGELPNRELVKVEYA